MIKTAPPKDSSPPPCSPAYVRFVQQSRQVLGLPGKSAPTERLNPSLHGLMTEVLHGPEIVLKKPTN